MQIVLASISAKVRSSNNLESSGNHQVIKTLAMVPNHFGVWMKEMKQMVNKGVSMYFGESIGMTISFIQDAFSSSGFISSAAK